MFRKVFFLLLLLFLLPACTAVPTLTTTDEVGIYAAVIERLVTRDDTFGGTLKPATVYILTQTDDTVGDPDSERAPSRTLSPTVQAEIARELAHLPARLIWVENQTDVPLDASSGAVADNGVIITLGNMHSQRNGNVLVSASIYIGSLAAGGQTYILENLNGVWVINGTTGVQWIS